MPASKVRLLHCAGMDIRTHRVPGRSYTGFPKPVAALNAAAEVLDSMAAEQESPAVPVLSTVKDDCCSACTDADVGEANLGSA